jgi:hypothetical protein
VINYGPKQAQGALEVGQKTHEPTTSLGGAPLGRTPLACRRLVDSPDVIPMPNTLIYIETSEKKPRSGVPPPQASVATKNQSGAHSGTLPEGETITGGLLHHPGDLHDEEGVVHPRG